MRSLIAVAAVACVAMTANALPPRWEWLPGQPQARTAKSTLPALPRAIVDRPDDFAGPQVHVMYVLPLDGVDEQLDTNGRIGTSVAAFNHWLLQQTPGRTLRVDTFEGLPDITFFRLALTDAQVRAMGAFVRDEIERELRSAGMIRDSRLYAVYYGGSSDVSCGGGAYPPSLPGVVGAMYLKGTPPGAPACATNVLGASVETPGYLDFGMVHELMHIQGFVAACAPHQVLAGHVSDSANDLMWAGDAPWQLPPRLDIGRDDYYQHGIAGCLDFSASPYLGTPRYQDLWWVGTSEDGWGMTLAQHGSTIFAALFVYDAGGHPVWYVLPGGSWNASFDTYSGNLYSPIGSWFGNYDATRFSARPPVGTASISFLGTARASLVYTINGTHGAKSIQRQIFRPPDASVPVDYSDIWWGGTAEDGWGVAITQQADVLFAVWYTYDNAGNTTWYVMPGGTWASATLYSGSLFRTTSSAWLGAAYDPTRFSAIPAGTLTLQFDDSASGRMSYTADGVSGSKRIVRQPF